MPGKLGMTTAHRMSVIKNQASSLLQLGRIETTKAKAKELKSYVEKIITTAIRTYEDVIEVEKVVKDAKGKDMTVKVTKDGPKKLAARRKIMSKLFDLQEIKGANETKAQYKERTGNVNHPIIEKLFNYYAPKYAQRAQDKGQGGGYTRIYLLGARKGDAAEKAIIELVD